MKNILLCLFLPALLSYFSCAASHSAVQQEAPVKTDIQVQPGAVSLEELFDRGYWVTRPEDAAITIIGIAGRRANRNEAIQEALADAARKAALYHGVRAESAATLNQGSGNLDYFSGFDYRVDPAEGHEAYIDALVFDENNDVLEKNGVVIVRTQYSGVLDIPAYESAFEDGLPGWVKNHAAGIPGFLAGVGYSQNKGSLQKTHTASYETALVSLLPLLSTKVSNETIDAGGAKLTSIVTKSEGELVNVMILETWFDKKTNSVWTLVAAKAKETIEPSFGGDTGEKTITPSFDGDTAEETMEETIEPPFSGATE
jgi:hypothetical protein